MPSFCRSGALVVTTLLLALPRLNAIVIDGFATATNDRFANNGSFFATGLDLSGIGRSSDGRWGTLISSNVFVSANHLHPAIGSTLTFHASNDQSGASSAVTVSSGQRIGSSDLWVGVLDTPLSGAFATYTFPTADITNLTEFESSAIAGKVGLMIGRSTTDWANQLHDVAVGANVLDFWADDSEAGGTTDDAVAAFYQFAATDVTFESLLQGGDSGAPLLTSLGGSSLQLTGINWWVGTATVSLIEYNVSGFSYLGNYDAQLQSIITASAVPEPAAAVLLVALGATLAVAYRRRRRGTAPSYSG